MVSYNQQSGISDAPSYQVSGVPYATASFTVPVSGSTPIAINFPMVAKFVTVVNTHSGTNAALRVGFSANGINGAVNNNYFTLDNGDSYTGEWRIASIFLLSDTTTDQTSASVIAGLTGIASTNVPGFVDGTVNWSGSDGVG